MRSSIVVAFALFMAVALWIGSGQFGQSTTQPQAKKPPVDLATMTPEMRVRVRAQKATTRVAQEILRGRTAAFRQVEIKAETDSLIERLLVERGSLVERGALLARLAADDRPARLREAKALLAQKEIEFEAAAKLATKGFRAETALAASRAELEAAEARVRIAEIELANVEIRAPFDGVIETKMAERGDFLKKGDPLLRIVDLTPILIVAQVGERVVGEFSVGQLGKARLVTGEEVEGLVSFISPVADAATRTFRVEMEIANPDRAISDGITAEMILDRKPVTAHKISPAILSLTDEGVVGVKVLTKEGRVTFKPVKIISNEVDGLWVTGLPEEVVFITVGQEFVVPGQAVIAIDEATLAPYQSPGDAG